METSFTKPEAREDAQVFKTQVHGEEGAVDKMIPNSRNSSVSVVSAYWKLFAKSILG